MIERLKGARWAYVLMSILLAFVFWLYVRTELDPAQPATLRNVRVELVGVSVLTRQGLTVAGLSDTTVELRIDAPVSTQQNLNRYRSDLWVTLDVSKCVEGENKVSYTPHYPENVNAESISTHIRNPSTITVTVEKLETRTFEVEFQLQGQVAQGYQMGTPAINPETVLVSGSIEQVNQIDKVAAILTNENLEERFAGDLPLTLLNSAGEVLTGLDVTLDNDTAYVIVPVVVVKEIPLKVNLVPGGGATEEDAIVHVDPPTIIVSGSEEDLAGLDELYLGSMDLADVVGSVARQMPINLSPNLENVSGNTTANVTVSVTGLATRTLEVENIQLVNMPAGYTVDLLTQVKSVMLRGPEEDLAAIDPSQILIVADLDGFTNQGTYSVPVRVILNAGGNAGIVNEYTVTVSISR
ncbi:MAG: hypothetical protein HFF50_03520 [Lawsonibacter sp.]|nr:hypothetical protein [Lawsonibacter sp.]